MIKTRKESDEVLYPCEEIVTITSPDLSELLRMAELAPRRRIRLCAHQSIQDEIHEMIIYHPKGTYVQPHKHKAKEESFHLISGEIDCVILDDKGHVRTVLPMGSHSSGEIFYYRIPADTFHMQIFREDTFFHEVTKGPFDIKDTICAHWAPSEKHPKKVKEYMAGIIHTIGGIKSN